MHTNAIELHVMRCVCMRALRNQYYRNTLKTIAKIVLTAEKRESDSNLSIVTGAPSFDRNVVSKSLQRLFSATII